MRTVTVNLYTFKELTEKAKDKARENVFRLREMGRSLYSFKEPME